MARRRVSLVSSGLETMFCRAAVDTQKHAAAKQNVVTRLELELAVSDEDDGSRTVRLKPDTTYCPISSAWRR
jgi:hypothetical protein